ncbi:hypothetical protein HOD05_04595 [Candidatus Woesearchaeota archaeon]|nr:hypothetical protein [Candidatus Woesearchaeota archaeon]MBT4150434.1 hypothetical protein [Candidatus Woesearchaeota archaeon]MBT4247491.1 hypothetical protein [Candidatus Woesearchaeota archaeon]MBT4434470.1 hypothetical protein [Candidatus Woesearchaeota archaeon]MBT7331676.1 hypothetical protein [Candidatus Woesearchaeota archaeon]
MVIHFERSLQDALEKIGKHEYHEFKIHSFEEEAKHEHDLIETYGNAKWAIVDILNGRYGLNVDLQNWLDHKEDDVAYFLNEAGSNSLHHSEFKAPYRLCLWLGENGFMISIEQKGKGFDASFVDSHRIKENEGAAFEFYRKCKGEVFFDDEKETRVIYYVSDISVLCEQGTPQ